jgi:FKBP-type peptidyl-prolyl cis-trans isomerase
VLLLLPLLLSTTTTNHYNVHESTQVKIFYEGSFPDGKVFDKNYNRKSPLTFRVGLGDVIKGMDRGMQLALKLALIVYIAC